MSDKRTLRVAVLIAGHLRTWTQCKAGFIEKIQTGHSTETDAVVDVFVHTYDRITMGGAPVTHEEIENRLLGVNVKKLAINNEDELAAHVKAVESKPEDMHWHSFMQVHKLKLCDDMRQQYERENGFEYDFIVKTRFDIRLNIPWIDYDNLSTDHCLVGRIGIQRPCDMFAVGPRHLMESYCQRANWARFGGCNSHDTLRHLQLQNPERWVEFCNGFLLRASADGCFETHAIKWPETLARVNPDCNPRKLMPEFQQSLTE